MCITSSFTLNVIMTKVTVDIVKNSESKNVGKTWKPGGGKGLKLNKEIETSPHNDIPIEAKKNMLKISRMGSMSFLI